MSRFEDVMHNLTVLHELLDNLHAAIHTGDKLALSHEDAEQMRITELAQVMDFAQDLKLIGDSIKSSLGAYYDDMRVKHIPTKMDDEGINSIDVDGVGKVILTDDLRVKVLDQEAQFEWLDETNNGSMIKQTVNAGSLKALLRRLMKSGDQPIPEEVFELAPFVRASIRKG